MDMRNGRDRVTGLSWVVNPSHRDAWARLKIVRVRTYSQPLNGPFALGMRRGRATTPIPQLSPANLVDEERWQQRLAELAESRDSGRDWPRHKSVRLIVIDHPSIDAAGYGIPEAADGWRSLRSCGRRRPVYPGKDSGICRGTQRRIRSAGADSADRRRLEARQG
jgi:hypothetical protein